jgi:2-polyprenyl-6-methoxyphenol hydroxylase-like FAD-dependent oxidoreductase
MSGHSVVISGGGPTGLMLAGELALAKIDVVVLERRPGQALIGSRAGGLHSRTIEILDQRGIADRFLAEGETAQAAGFALNFLDIGDFPTRHPYALGLWQNHIERILAEWVVELGVPIEYGREVTGFIQDDSGVDVKLADGGSVQAGYLVGCDGGRSLVRKAAGIEFPGWDPTTSALIAEVEMAGEPELGSHQDELGVRGMNRLEDGKTIRVIITEQRLGPAGDATLRELSEALRIGYGTDFGVHSPIWISRFTDMTRQAASYREGRVLLAGDSAHIHYPSGGQGIQNGIQDAVNLGWKLAQVIRGTSSDILLDTYQAERHPIVARSLRHTMAQTALLRADGDMRVEALRDTIAETLTLDEPRKHFAALVSGLDIRYDLGDGHPLLGRRMPDLDIETVGGPLRVYTLLHDARPAFLNFGEPGAFDLAPWADRVRSVEARHDGPWELPVIGEVPAPGAVLVRPDGHVAWIGGQTRSGLAEALTTWFGPPTAA